MKQSKQPLVSVLIPNFNQKGLIGQAVESALKQTYSNLVVIVCDDGSTDSSVKEIKKDKRVRLHINPKNLGRIQNHHHLLHNLSEGEYVVMLDGDDYLLDKDFIKNAVLMAEDNNLDLVFGEARILDHTKREFAPGSYPLPQSGIYSYLDIFNKNILFMHGGVLYRRKKAIALKFYSAYDIVADDNESFFRLVLNQRVGFLKKPVYVYRVNINPKKIVKYNLATLVLNSKLFENTLSKADELSLPARPLIKKWARRGRSMLYWEAIFTLAKGKRYFDIIRFKFLYLKQEGVGKTILAVYYPLISGQIYGKIGRKIFRFS